MTGAVPRASTLRVAARLAGRELRGGLRGFRLFLACLALGVATIAAVGGLSEAVLDGLARDGRAILGGDLELRLSHRPATAAERAWLAARAKVSEVVELRAMARPADGGRSALVELRAVDDAYPLYGTLETSPRGRNIDALLAYRDGAWGAIAEPALVARFTGIETPPAAGLRVRIGEAVYEIRAVATREPDRATRLAAFGPHILVAGESLAATGLVRTGSLIRYHYRLRVAPDDEAAALRRALDVAFPEAGWRVRSAAEAAPGVRRLVERLGQYLTLVGLSALLIGGLGVGNAVRNYLAGRAPTIAILKSLGASSRLMTAVYLIQVLALAFGGILVGLAVGGLAPWLAAWPLQIWLGWDLALGLAPGPLATAAGLGLLTTVAFSLWPLARAAASPAAHLFRARVAAGGDFGVGGGAKAVTVAAVFGLAVLAIAGARDPWLGLYFVAGAALAFGVLRLAGAGIETVARHLPRPRRPDLRLALANLHRPDAPTVPVVLSLGLGLTVLVAVALVEANLDRQVRESLPARAPAFYFLDIQPGQLDAFQRLAAETPGFEGQRHVPMLRGRIVSVNGVPTERLSIPPDVAWVFRGDRGLTWARQAPDGAEVTAGTWWPEDYNGPPLVSLDRQVAQAMDLSLGDRIGINVLGRTFEAEIANLRAIDWGSLNINFVMVFSPEPLRSAPQSYIATVAVDADSELALERAVTERFANVSALRVRDALDAIADILGHIAVAVRATAALALLAGALVLAGALAAGQERRIYDAVVLKVLGATRREVMSAMLMEYGLLGLASLVVAVPAGALAAYVVLTQVMHAPFVLLPGPVAVTVAVAAVLTLGFGLFGTWRALGRKAAPLLRNR